MTALYLEPDSEEIYLEDEISEDQKRKLICIDLETIDRNTLRDLVNDLMADVPVREEHAGA